MALSGRDRTRYARHLLLAQLGETGQERLLAAHVRANGDADAGALTVAHRYLTRAGVSVLHSPPAGPRASLRPEDSASDERAPSPVHVATATQIAEMAGHPALHEAARALAGALSAVGALSALLGLTGSTLSGAPLQPQIIFAISSEEA